MRRFDEPLEPEVATALLAIDATLEGDPVDPEHAELAELALILSAERPQPPDAFAAALDQRVAARFARPARASGSRPARRRWLYAPGAMAAGAAVVAIVVGLSSLPSGSSSSSSSSSPSTASAESSASSGVGAPAATATSASAAAPRRDLKPLVPDAKPAPATAGSTAGAGGGVNSGSAGAAAASAPAGAPQAPTTGRQVVQSAQLALSARPSQIDNVAQEVFDVIASEKGVVNNSHVTATNGSDGYATFQLSVPSSSLSATMSALSRLDGARVVSRTDASQDITGAVGGAGRRLADARALRRSLLKQLAAATTTEQVDSLKVQIRDNEASISNALVVLGKLHGQVNSSSISVTINAAPAPVGPVTHGSTFSLGRSAHDAGRVLVVVAGVALIALAVLVPLGLVTALAAWIGLAVRRRRRDQVLDLL